MARGHNIFISFDLVHPLDNYERLARVLATLGTPVKVSTMFWYLDTAMDAREVQLVLRSACNAGDSMAVVDASTNYVVLHNHPVPSGALRRNWNPTRPAVIPPPAAVAAAEKPASDLPTGGGQ